MYRNNGLGAFRNLGFDEIRIQIVGRFIDIDEDGGGADGAHRFRGREKSKRRDDNLVPRSHAQRAKADDQGVRAGVQPHRVLHAEVLGDFRLERFYVGAHDELAAFERPFNGLSQFGHEAIYLTGKIQNGNSHGFSLTGFADGGIG